ncbi:hypothetical protein BE08_02410 [Sorangium cellulosum]|uniref:Uncharacterized protein n=1 Tax=Sorangium cellulosum TaxID=56 RepID=A0A150P4G4_SORCE|nr:hypothetical protein BE08_02410 [Sorangium cellulosum]
MTKGMDLGHRFSRRQGVLRLLSFAGQIRRHPFLRLLEVDLRGERLDQCGMFGRTDLRGSSVRREFWCREPLRRL